MTVSLDQLQVTSFETTVQPVDIAGGGTPLCDSPLCVPSQQPRCPETTIAI